MRSFKIRNDIINTRGEKVIALLVSLLFLLFYVGFQSSSIYGGDAGDLVTAAYLHGVPHPPGYPLYTFLGWLLTYLPFSTVAWRVTLLSSIPSALTIGLLFFISTRLTKKIIPSLIAVFTLGFTYLFWLYASVPEVFALHSFFVVLIFYLLLRYVALRNIFWLLGACFVFGLSLTHHHITVFMLPAYAYLLYPLLKSLKSKWKLISQSLLAIMLGLLPYIYVVLAASTHPPINWENPVTPHRFIRLVTRAMYGTFRSNQGLGHDPAERFTAVKISAETMLIDFTLVGVALGLFGAYAQYRKDKRMFFTIAIAFFTTGPLFTFYASFPVLQNFTLGTTERFLLIPYVLFSFWLAYGIIFLSTQIDTLLKKVAPHIKVSSLVLFSLFPLSLFLINFTPIQGLKDDRTAEHFAEDILKSTPEKAVLFLLHDIPLFNTQYVYFTNGGRQKTKDIKLIHTGILGGEFYKEVLTHQYPDIDFSSIFQPNNEDFITKFADRYFDELPILSDSSLPIPSEKYGWVIEGLLFRLYRRTTDKEPISKVDYMNKVEPLLSSYHNPKSGALGTYTHVMLAEVLRLYSTAYHEVAKQYVRVGEHTKAAEYTRLSLEYEPQLYEAKLTLAKSMIGRGQCAEAETELTAYIDLIYSNPEPYALLSYLFENCYKDSEKAKQYGELYQQKLNQQEAPISNE